MNVRPPNPNLENKNLGDNSSRKHSSATFIKQAFTEHTLFILLENARNEQLKEIYNKKCENMKLDARGETNLPRVPPRYQNLNISAEWFVHRLNNLKRPSTSTTKASDQAWKSLDRKSKMFIQDVASVLNNHYVEGSRAIELGSNEVSSKQPKNMFQAFVWEAKSDIEESNIPVASFSSLLSGNRETARSSSLSDNIEARVSRQLSSFLSESKSPRPSALLSEDTDSKMHRFSSLLPVSKRKVGIMPQPLSMPADNMETTTRPSSLLSDGNSIGRQSVYDEADVSDDEIRDMWHKM